MSIKRTPKVEALVVNAIRRLQDVQGSTSREISNYISQEYNVPSEIRRQVQFALRRGLSYGILKRLKGGYYSCDHDYLRQFSLGNGTGDGVMEPCPSQPWRFGVRKRKREKARRRRYQRERRERERREREKKKRGRRRRSTTRRRRGRSRRRRPRRSRARRGRRPTTSRRRRRRRTRRRSRRGVRARTRANPSSEMQMEATSPEPLRNDADRKEDPHKSESSVSVHSIERHSQNSSQNSQMLNTSDI
ncbi:PREDICTED: luc7-like protein 3 [Cyphomyrmex costatus]|nr:PREDICTED: luc7-like protein 3 [Cyphomyrmex costatus]